MITDAIKSYRARLFIIPCILFVFVGIFANIMLETQLSSWMRDHIEEELLWQARSASDVFHSVPHDNITIEAADKIADRLGDQTHTRFTIIAEDGKVLGDSELRRDDIALIETHAQRPEVKNALKNGHASSIHFSKALGTDMLYVATIHSHHGNKFIIRASRSLSEIDENISGIRSIMLFVSIVSLSIITALAWFVSKLATRTIEKEQNRLEDRASKRANEIEILQELAGMLSTSDSLDEAKDIVANISGRLFLGFGGALTIINSSRNLSEAIITWGGQWPGESVFEPTACWSLRKGEIHLTHNNETGFKCKHFNSQVEPVSSLCIPMIAHGETVGAFHLTSKVPDVFDDEKIKLASSLARQVSLTVANLDLRSTLKNQAIRDPLTGLFNRRYMEEMLEREARRARRHKTSFGVMMIDIDHFKRFNDDFGHDAGDHALKELANLFKIFIRHEDIACRYGGEEFTIILPESNADVLKKRALELGKMVSEINIVHKNRVHSKLTVSIGLASYPDHSDDIASILKSADNALYQAKREGRNRVVVAGTHKDRTKKNIQSVKTIN